MKFLLTLILAFLSLASFSKKPERLSIIPGKNDRMELKYNSKSKRTTKSVITITDASGKIICTQSADLVFGNNTISLSETAGLSEGSYTAQMKSGNKIIKSQFIVWK